MISIPGFNGRVFARAAKSKVPLALAMILALSNILSAFPLRTMLVLVPRSLKLLTSTNEDVFLDRSKKVSISVSIKSILLGMSLYWMPPSFMDKLAIAVGSFPLPYVPSILAWNETDPLVVRSFPCFRILSGIKDITVFKDGTSRFKSILTSNSFFSLSGINCPSTINSILLIWAFVLWMSKILVSLFTLRSVTNPQETSLTNVSPFCQKITFWVSTFNPKFIVSSLNMALSVRLSSCKLAYICVVLSS